MSAKTIKYLLATVTLLLLCGFSIDYTPKVKAMEGTPTCPFCPPGEPNEIIEVFTKDPVTWIEDIVVVTGTFSLTKNPEMGLFFQLKNAAQ